MAVFVIVKSSELKTQSWAVKDIVGPAPASDVTLKHQLFRCRQALSKARNEYNKIKEMRQFRKDFQAGKTRWKAV